jgi:hypothetical protein
MLSPSEFYLVLNSSLPPLTLSLEAIPKRLRR